MTFSLWRRQKRDEELNEELQSHLEMAASDRMERGEKAELARRAALREFGNVGLVKEVTRDKWGWRWLSDLARDIRIGVRALRKSPGFTVAAVLTLALGIGANTAVFSAVHAVLLSPLPFDQPDRIVTIIESNPSKGFPAFPASPPNYLDWRNSTSSFEAMASVASGKLAYTSGSEPEMLSGANVGPSFFSVFGAEPGMGRTFLAEDDVEGKASVVVLSYGLWTRQFGSNPQVLGKQLTLNGHAYRVIGVMKERFQFPRGTELWLPQEFSKDDLGPGARGAHFLHVVARLKKGISLREAQAEMQAVSGRLGQQYPKTNQGWTSGVLSLKEATVGEVRPTLLVLFGAVGFLLLIACANVANLLLARASARQREIAVRFSLGASRWRLARQFLTESVVLSGAASAAGLFVAEWAIRALRTLPASNLPRAAGIQLDLPVLGFTATIAIFTGLLFGIAPALQITRGAPAETLKHGARTVSPGGSTVRSALVVVEATLALMLLVGSGVLLRSFVRLQSVDLGFQPKNVVTGDIALPKAKYSTDERQIQFFEQFFERMKTVRDTETALANDNPMQSTGYLFAFTTKELQALSPNDQPSAGYYIVSPNYFETLRIPLLAGRNFTPADRAGSPRVAIISQSLARRFFHGRNPLGQSIAIGVGGGKTTWREIVGVVGDVKDNGPAEEGSSTVYEPYTQMAWSKMTAFVRADGDPAQLATAVRSVVATLDKDQPVSAIATGEELMSQAVAQPQLRTLLLGLFAAIALILASLGIYGVMSNAVAQRTHEIGVRMALGAGQSSVLRMVMSQGVKLTALGLALGTAGALGLTGLMKGFLFQVKPSDPTTFFAVTLFLFLVALVASYIPARRAMRVDPVVALRYE